MRKEVQIAEFASDGIDGAGRSNADASDLDAGALLHFAKHADDACKAGRIVRFGSGHHLVFGEHLAVLIDQANRQLGSSNVYGTNHKSLALDS